MKKQKEVIKNRMNGIKKSWLDFLFYKLGFQHYDFRIAKLYIKDGVAKSSKWISYKDFCFPIDVGEEKVLAGYNNREILPNELVIDLEDKKYYEEVIKDLIKIRKNDRRICFYVCDTGSRGYHIHIFVGKKEIKQETKDYLIKEWCGDTQKAFSGSSIALEFAEHYKSNKINKIIFATEEFKKWL